MSDRLTKRQRNLLLWHILNGRHSGIPLCCSLFYAKENMRGFGVAYRVCIERGDEWPGNPDVHYVQCNHCYNTNRIETLKLNGTIAEHLLEDD